GPRRGGSGRPRGLDGRLAAPLGVGAAHRLVAAVLGPGADPERGGTVVRVELDGERDLLRAGRLRHLRVHGPDAGRLHELVRGRLALVDRSRLGGLLLGERRGGPEEGRQVGDGAALAHLVGGRRVAAPAEGRRLPLAADAHVEAVVDDEGAHRLAGGARRRERQRVGRLPVLREPERALGRGGEAAAARLPVGELGAGGLRAGLVDLRDERRRVDAADGQGRLGAAALRRGGVRRGALLAAQQGGRAGARADDHRRGGGREDPAGAGPAAALLPGRRDRVAAADAGRFRLRRLRLRRRLRGQLGEPPPALRLPGRAVRGDGRVLQGAEVVGDGRRALRGVLREALADQVAQRPGDLVGGDRRLAVQPRHVPPGV